MAKRVVCIDLGSTQTRVWVRGKGNIFDEPTAMAVEIESGKPVEIGYLADKAAGRSPAEIVVMRPVLYGAVADVDACAMFIQRIFDNQRMSGYLRGATVIASRPDRLTKVELDALRTVFAELSVRRFIPVSGTTAAALGAGVDTSSPRGILVLDIGGGTSDCAAVALGKTAVCHTVKVGGISFDRAVIKYAKRARNLVLGNSTAESCKMRIGSLSTDTENQFLEVTGRDISSGLPSTAILSTAELRPSFLDLADKIADNVLEVIQDVAPELASDLVRSGVLVTGAGAQLGGMKEYLSRTLKIPVHFAAEPANGTMVGLQRLAERPDI